MKEDAFLPSCEPEAVKQYQSRDTNTQDMRARSEVALSFQASPGSGDKEERGAGTIRISSPGACKCSSRVCCSLIHPRCWWWSRDLEPVPKPSVPILCSVVTAGPSPCFLIRNTQLILCAFFFMGCLANFDERFSLVCSNMDASQKLTSFEAI